ncbi:hypothetical protein H6768_03115 [Candidatus Peribacteria bacterium]|nr:hypothetical protein [Candidatus Peribacteria bacterium]
MMSKIIDGNESLMTLINDILDLSKIESGKTPFKIEKITLEELIQDIYSSFQGLMGEKNINFSLVKKLREEYPFSTDKSKFILVINNLLSNAYKYTPDNGDVTWILSTVFKNSNPYLHISVKDSGVGIPKEEIPKVFDRFASISTHNKIKTKIQSTGL